MTRNVVFDHVNPVSVHDILWSWSCGYLSRRDAIEALHLDDEMALYEAAYDNDVPFPGTASAEDVRMADEFVDAISEVA